MKNKFIKAFGNIFVIDDPEKYPDYHIVVGASRTTALIDATKFDKKVEWKALRKIDIEEKYGYLIKDGGDEIAYNMYFVRKAFNILNPNEYTFHEALYTKEVGEEKMLPILLLRNLDYIISIAPISLGDDYKDGEWSIEPLENYIKDAPSSVFEI